MVDDPSAYDDSAPKLPPESAFRESLFDALADDEGASFWEGVYGQPIHNYPDSYTNQETGELERMDDEEYAQYVRRKMWEKSWEGIEAAKEQQRKDREQEKQRMREAERGGSSRKHNKTREPDYLFDLDIEQSLRRGERLKERRYWKSLWEKYLRQWDDLDALRGTRTTSDTMEQLSLRNKIAWPVESGKRKDVSSDEIEKFVQRCAEAADDSDATIGSLLKAERVRWHPDKIQQRYGFMEIDEKTMQGVTAVFQVFDQMWSELRDRKG